MASNVPGDRASKFLMAGLKFQSFFLKLALFAMFACAVFFAIGIGILIFG